MWYIPYYSNGIWSSKPAGFNLFLSVSERKEREIGNRYIKRERVRKEGDNSKRESEENHNLLIELKFSAHFDTKLILRIYSNVEKQYC